MKDNLRTKMKNKRFKNNTRNTLKRNIRSIAKFYLLRKIKFKERLIMKLEKSKLLNGSRWLKKIERLLKLIIDSKKRVIGVNSITKSQLDLRTIN